MPWIAALCLGFFSGNLFASFTPPDQAQTPGHLCSPQDPNFKGYDYPEKVARCERNVSRDDKLKVAAAYGNLPPREWPKYEFDHLIPLCVGGSNSLSNLWPQPIEQAQIKNQLENEVCLDLRAGSLTQNQAVEKMHTWFAGMAAMAGSDPKSDVYCRTRDGISLRFDVVKASWIKNVHLIVEDQDSEQTAVQLEGSVVGKALNAVRVFHLSGGNSKPSFSVFLPLNLAKSGKGFVALIKKDGDHQKGARLFCIH